MLPGPTDGTSPWKLLVTVHWHTGRLISNAIFRAFALWLLSNAIHLHCSINPCLLPVTHLPPVFASSFPSLYCPSLCLFNLPSFYSDTHPSIHSFFLPSMLSFPFFDPNCPPPSFLCFFPLPPSFSPPAHCSPSFCSLIHPFSPPLLARHQRRDKGSALRAAQEEDTPRDQCKTLG